MTRVVITGMGTVNPIGADVASFWQACLAGHSGIRTVSEFDIPAGMSQVAGIIDLDWHGGRPLAEDLADTTDLDRSARLAITAAREAVENAQLGIDDIVALRPDRAGVSISTAIAGIGRMEAVFRAESAQGAHRLAPLEASDGSGAPFLFDTTSALVARSLGLPGEHVSVVTGCTGAIDALGHAVAMLRNGICDLVVTGAAEAPITPLVVASFARINATSLNPDPARASRPWTLERDGFVLAEGAGMMVLETLEHAQRRQAPIIAEVSGFGSVNNYFHMTSMPQDGGPLARSIQLALDDAGMGADEIDVINAHGSSTPMNDLAESNAFATVFGKRSAIMACSSQKSQIGHPLSAANGVELIASALSLRDQVQPPTLNRDGHDPQCQVRLSAVAEPLDRAQHLIKTSSGFSGIHSALVMSRYQESA